MGDGGAGEAQSLSGDCLFGRFAHPRQLDPQAAVSTAQPEPFVSRDRLDRQVVSLDPSSGRLAEPVSVGEADGVTVAERLPPQAAGSSGRVTRKTTRAAPATVTQMPQRNYVPLRDASVADNSIQAAYRESQIKDAPSIDPRGADPRRGS
jgi:hypothetical protein